MIGEFEDLDVNLEDVDEIQLVVSEERDPEVPFWRIPKKEFLTLLRIIDGIASRNSDAVSRSILLWENNGYLHYSMTNRDVYLRGRLELKNQQNILQEKVILSSKQLLDVAKFSADVLIYKQDDQMYSSIMRGRYPLEEYTFSESIYKLEEKPESYSEGVDLTVAKQDFDLFVRLMSQAVLSEDKKIVIKDGYAYGNFVSIIARKQVSYPDMTLTMLNAKDVAALILLYGSELRIGVTDDRLYFRGSGFEYSVVSLRGEVSSEVVNKFVGDLDGILIDGNQMFNLFSFLSINTTDSSIVEVEGGQEGIKFINRTKSGKMSEFDVAEFPVENMNFKMQVVSAKKAFTVLKFYPSLMMKKVDNCLTFDGEDFRLMLSIRG